jgi:mRNA interferase MazF
MSLPIKIYKRFEVVLVPFPFTDSGAVKRRPALVLSDETVFNSLVGRSVLAMITTVSHSPWALDVLIADLAATGLKQPSTIRMKLFT